MEPNLKISTATPLLLTPSNKGNTRKAEQKTVLKEEANLPVIKKAPVKNIHSQIFKEFRRALYTPPVYNKEEINMLLADQQTMTEQGTETGLNIK